MRQLDWEKEIPKIMSGRKNGSNILEFRSPLFSIKAVKSTDILDGSSSYSKYNPLVPDQKDKTPFGIITTIKSISKSAVERNRVRTRFKEAMRLALTRDLTAPSPGDREGDGRDSLPRYVDLPSGKSGQTALAMDHIEVSHRISLPRHPHRRHLCRTHAHTGPANAYRHCRPCEAGAERRTCSKTISVA